MASSHDTSRSISEIPPTASVGSRSNAQQGQQQQQQQQQQERQGEGAGDAHEQVQQQKSPPQQQQQGQQQGGRRLRSLLRKVAGYDELLKDCIQAREELGAAKMKTMRAREEARQATRARGTPSSLVFDGESWDWSNADDSDGADGIDWFEAETAASGGTEREELAAMAAAGPLVGKFADKMEELANILPDLSRSLVELTAATIAARPDGPRTPSAKGKTGGEGAGTLDSDLLPSDAFDELQDLIKVVCPALARLLSFEHLRASEPTGRELVQALVNLYVGMAPGLGAIASQAIAGGISTSVQSASSSSMTDFHDKTPGPATANSGGVRTPSSAGSRSSMDSGRATIGASSGTVYSGASRDSSTTTSQMQQDLQREKLGKKATSWVAGIIKQMLTPKVYGGKLVRSKGLDELLGKRGVTAAHHDRAVQVELLRNIEVLQSLTMKEEGFGTKHQTTTTHSPAEQQPIGGIDGGVPSAGTNSGGAGSNTSSNRGGQQQQKHQQPSGRKRPRSSAAAGAAAKATSTRTELSEPVVDGPARAVETLGAADLHRRPLNSSTFWARVDQDGYGGTGNSKRKSASSAKSGGDAGFSRLFCRHDHDHDIVERESRSDERKQLGWGASRATVGSTATTMTEDRSAAALLENTLRSSCCMLQTRGGHSGLPVQLLRACLQQDAYLLPPAPARGNIISPSSLAVREPLLRPGDDHVGLPAAQGIPPSSQQTKGTNISEGVSQTTRPPPTSSSHFGASGSSKISTTTVLPLDHDGTMSPRAMQSRHGRPSPLPPPPIPLPVASLLLSKDRVSSPAAWEERVRGCLSALERRPLLCPDALLRETGAVPPLPSEMCVRGAMAVHGSDLDVENTGNRNTHNATGTSTSSKTSAISKMVNSSASSPKTGEFELSEACLRVGLNLVENAVLQPGNGGAEAAAGLLRAFRTVRNRGVGVRAHGGGVSRDARALAGGCRARVKGEALFEFVATLDQTPSGCVEASLDVLVFALDELGKKHGRGEPRQHEERVDFFGSTTVTAVGIPSSPLARSFEQELWLLVLGYRHWIMLAMVHLLATNACASCDTHQDQRQAPAVRLLAWYACGGCALTGMPQAELAEAQEGVIQMAKCLSEHANQGHATAGGAAVESQTRGAKSSTVAEARTTGDRGSSSPAPSPGAQVATALEAARESGQGWMGAIFSPCLALAWLLTSRVALCNCESILACSVFREEDLSEVFRGKEEFGAGRDLALGEGSTHPPSSISSRCSVEAVLQGLAALEDLVWLCSLSPPLAHVHKGRDLKTLLTRIMTWVSGIGGSATGLDEESRPYGGDGGDGLRGDRDNRMLADFCHRSNGISQRIARLLLRL
ncbi:unnamed protein product [Scytosiphon promiscuus]